MQGGAGISSPGAAPSLADPHSLYGRASRIMLNGVSVARLTLGKRNADVLPETDLRLIRDNRSLIVATLRREKDI